MNDFLSALINVNIEIPNSTDLKASLIFLKGCIVTILLLMINKKKKKYNKNVLSAYHLVVLLFVLFKILFLFNFNF
jgi:hypothetical protein